MCAVGVTLVAFGACSVDYKANQSEYDRLKCGQRCADATGGFGGDFASGGFGGSLGTGGFATGGSLGSGGFSGTGGSTGDAPETCVSGDQRCVGTIAENCVNQRWLSTQCLDPTPACELGACVVCVEGTRRCNGTMPELCVSHVWVPQTPCTAYQLCVRGSCVAPPSCDALQSNCGPTASDSCCASSVVPGGTYFRANDGNYPATVSDFYLDKYEVTVGRFRKFVAGYPANLPAAGDGANPKIAGSGWDTSWVPNLPLTSALLESDLKCSGTYDTWTDTPGTNENKPINCVEWHIAFAFCAWDGGRLPTEAEWNYAACGGSEQRRYPWGNVDPGADTTLAVYGCYLTGGTCSGASIATVGSAPSGAGKWGQLDLAGNMREWMLDNYGTFVNPCLDCADLSTAFYQVVRSSEFSVSGAQSLLTSFRASEGPYQQSGIGLRCARSP